MLYNTIDTCVHKMTIQLNNISEQRWKALEEKWNGHESSKNERAAGQLSSGRVKETHVTSQCTQKALPLHPSLSPKIRSMPSIETIKRSSEQINVQVILVSMKHNFLQLDQRTINYFNYFLLY